MPYKKCPSGTTLVKSFKKKSGSKTRSYCRTKPKYKTSRKKKGSVKRNIKKSIKHKRNTPKKKPKSRVKSKPKSRVKSRTILLPAPRQPSPVRTRSKFRDMTVQEKIETIKAKLEKISGVKLLTKSDINKIIAEYSNNLYKCLDDKFQLHKFIGKGVNGSVYMTCSKSGDPNNCKIIKIQEIINKNLIQNEINMQNIFNKYNLAPKIHKTCVFKKGKKEYMLIEMDPIIGIVETLLYKQLSPELLKKILNWIIDIIDLLCKYNLTHGDLHWGNVGYNVSPAGDLEPILIDFSWSSNKGCYPRLEFIQALRTVSIAKMHKSNEKYLEDSLYEIYTKNYNSKLKKSIKAFDQEYDRLMDEYEKKI